MKKVVAFVLAIAMSLSLVACGGGDSSTSGGSSMIDSAVNSAGSVANEDIEIAYVSGDLANEIFAKQVEAMAAYSDEIGVTFLNTPCLDDAAKITAIENYIQAGVDVIICHVSTASTIEDSMKAAQEAGIKFFCYDTPIDGCDAFFGWDNYDYGWSIGVNAANWVNENFADGETCYAVSANYPTSDFLVVREQGYIDALNELCEGKVEWVGEAVGGSTANGVTAGENWLQMGQDINLVVGINDAGCLGVMEAFKAAGYGGDKVAIFAGDAVGDAINAMLEEDSIYRGTVLTGLVFYAEQFIDICVNLANGGEEPYYYGGLWFITPENVAAYAESGDANDLELYKEYYTVDKATAEAE